MLQFLLVNGAVRSRDSVAGDVIYLLPDAPLRSELWSLVRPLVHRGEALAVEQDM